MMYPKKAGIVIAGMKESNNIPKPGTAPMVMNGCGCLEEGSSSMNEAVRTVSLMISASFFKKRKQEGGEDPTGDPL